MYFIIFTGKGPPPGAGPAVVPLHQPEQLLRAAGRRDGLGPLGGAEQGDEGGRGAGKGHIWPKPVVVIASLVTFSHGIDDAVVRHQPPMKCSDNHGGAPVIDYLTLPRWNGRDRFGVYCICGTRRDETRERWLVGNHMMGGARTII